MGFRDEMAAFCGQLDPVAHAGEIAILRRFRSKREIDQRVQREGGWLTPAGPGPRLKLVVHGSGALMVVSYDDGWSKRLALQMFLSGR
ncbi:MAG: hypothetical protein JXX28_01145 [Deltaproteobacteria bacterium]|nr:hypothetical protein [Deltaproteobacteria bacterium]